MQTLQNSYSRIKVMARMLATIGLVGAGLFTLFFTPSEKLPAGGILGDTGVAHAETPADSATSSDSCGCGSDSCS